VTQYLNGQSVLVVGAGGGIGAATAKAFADAGAHVIVAGRPGLKLDETSKAAGAELLALDFLDNHAVEAAFRAAEPFDHVVPAQAILFAATNPFATGSTITVDGGGAIA